MSEWRHESYPSGTQIVKNYSDARAPHYYVHGPYVGDESVDDVNRSYMCQDLLAFLLGGPRPTWLDDFTRVSEHSLRAVDGSSIVATGPMVANSIGSVDEDESPAAVDARARMIDRLMVRKELKWLRE